VNVLLPSRKLIADFQKGGRCWAKRGTAPFARRGKKTDFLACHRGPKSQSSPFYRKSRCGEKVEELSREKSRGGGLTRQSFNELVSTPEKGEEPTQPQKNESRQRNADVLRRANVRVEPLLEEHVT